jgi:hypothetical protein
MRKFFGTVLILGGVLALADFAIWGATHAPVSGGKSHLLLPLLATGDGYPEPIKKLCFGLGLFFFGLYLVLLEGDMKRSPLSLLFMSNALLLCFSLLVAFSAAQPIPGSTEAVAPLWVGIASVSALVSALTGLALLYFASTERPVGAAGLSIGSVLYVSSVAMGAVVFLSGKAG